MSLVEHAERELKLAGLFDKDSDYDGMLGKSVLALVKVFAKQGHSGFSAHQTLKIFNIVGRYKVLTPLTSDPEDWNDISEMNGSPMWQNKRQSSCFSYDGGKTWHDIDAPKKKWFEFWK